MNLDQLQQVAEALATDLYGDAAIKALALCIIKKHLLQALRDAKAEALPSYLVDLKALAEFRKSCHDSYNGGHHEPATNEAFHHGMDTICNILEDWVAKQATQRAAGGRDDGN